MPGLTCVLWTLAAYHQGAAEFYLTPFRRSSGAAAGVAIAKSDLLTKVLSPYACGLCRSIWPGNLSHSCCAPVSTPVFKHAQYAQALTNLDLSITVRLVATTAFCQHYSFVKKFRTRFTGIQIRPRVLWLIFPFSRARLFEGPPKIASAFFGGFLQNRQKRGYKKDRPSWSSGN